MHSKLERGSEGISSNLFLEVLNWVRHVAYAIEFPMIMKVHDFISCVNGLQMRKGN